MHIEYVMVSTMIGEFFQERERKKDVIHLHGLPQEDLLSGGRIISTDAMIKRLNHKAPRNKLAK